ncbi:MAG: PAS domain-containing protein [Acidobacteria bacterium]|nr:PAS domain-containing protein [Acidobacteriota bacterium]
MDSLSTRLGALIVLALTPVLGLAVWAGVVQQRSIAEKTREHGMSLARVSAAAQERTLDEVRGMLYGLADVPVVRQGNARECSAYLAAILPHHHGLANVGVAGPGGALLCSALPFVPPIDVSDLTFFIRAVRTRRFAAGEFQKGLLTARYALNVAIPVLSRDGAVARVLFAAVDEHWLNELAAEARLPEGASLVVADRTGTIMARHPDPLRYTGHRLPTEMTSRMRGTDHGTVEAPGIDGITRLHAYVAVASSGETFGYVSVGIPASAAYAEYQRFVARGLLLLVAALVVAFAGSWVGARTLVLRPARRLLDVAGRVEAGDYSARSGGIGSGELARLSAVFDRMTAALEQRDAERRTAEEAMRELNASLERRVEERTAQLAEANAFLDSVVEALPAMLFVKDARDLRFVRFNRAGEDLLGLSRQELIGRTDFDFFPREQAEFFVQQDRVTLAAGRVVDIPEEAIRTASGDERFLHTRKIPIRDDQGRPRYLLGISTDITERRATARVLAETQQRLQAVLDNSPVAIFIKDLEGRYLLVNRFYSEIAGRSPQEIVGRNSDELFPPELAAVYAAHDREVRESRAAMQWEEHAASAAGPRVFMVSRFPLLDGGGKPYAIGGIAVDITRRKKAEEEARLARLEAEQANRAKSRFLSRMSHDFRTPLNAILGFTQLLQIEALSPEEKECVAQIKEAGEHLLALLNDVLDIARIEAGKLSLALEPVGVADLVDRCLALVAPLAAARGVSSKPVHGEARTDHVLADRHRLTQVLLNLLSNAVKYNHRGGSIEVSCLAHGLDRLRIVVSDTGPGIPPDKVPRLFVPFDRLGAEQSQTEGTGLGLTVARELARAMSGEIGLETREGAGSSFWIELPRAAAPAGDGAAPAPRDSAPSPARPDVVGTILYIDDNRANLRLLERVMARRPGVRVLTALTGAEGIEAARRHHPGVLFLDLNLPDMHGHEVVRLLKTDPATASLPIAIISGDVTGAAATATGEQVVAHFAKPFDVVRVLQFIDRMLSDRRQM